jgi:hypothetical protein
VSCADVMMHERENEKAQKLWKGKGREGIGQGDEVLRCGRPPCWCKYLPLVPSGSGSVGAYLGALAGGGVDAAVAQ